MPSGLTGFFWTRRPTGTLIRKKVILIAGAIGSIALLVLLFIRYEAREGFEAREVSSASSPRNEWIAIVREEVYNTAEVINVAHDTIRIKRPRQTDSLGDLVLAMDSVGDADKVRLRWATNEELIISLPEAPGCLYFKNKVDGVTVILGENGPACSASIPVQRK